MKTNNVSKLQIAGIYIKVFFKLASVYIRVFFKLIGKRIVKALHGLNGKSILQALIVLALMVGLYWCASTLPNTESLVADAESGATVHAESGATVHAESGATVHAESGATVHAQSGATVDAVSEATKVAMAEKLAPVMEAILSKSSNAFTGDSVVDEGLLLFVANTFGEDALVKLSETECNAYEQWHEATGYTLKAIISLYEKQTGANPTETQRTIYKTDSSKEYAVLDFAGDVNFVENFGTTKLIDENGFENCISKEVLDELNSADLCVLNNECTYTSRGKALEGKTYIFGANPKRSEYLKKMGADMVSLANNHVWDFGEEGVCDTIDAINQLGMPVIGAGKNLKEACEPAYLICAGVKIAVVSATQIERTLNFTKQATEDTCGVLKCLNPALYCSVIEKAKANSDYVIAYVHWGTEDTSTIGADQIQLANSFVAAGADVIMGGHTHTTQEVKYINNTPVFYSLGNFFFSLDENVPKNYHTMIAQLHISAEGIEPYVISCAYEDGKLIKKDMEQVKRN